MIALRPVSISTFSNHLRQRLRISSALTPSLTSMSETGDSRSLPILQLVQELEESYQLDLL
jgi:hypothetical protein